HKGLALRFGHDPGVAHKLYLAWTLWLLGYPDQALARAKEALALARRLEHPMTLAFASCDVAMIHCYRGEHAVAKEIADTAVQLCQEHKLALWLAWGNMMAGWARSGLGDYHSGVGQFREGLTGWKGSGARAGMTFFPATAAECCRRAGWLDQAAELVAEACDIVIKNDEHYYEAELLHLQGELALAAGNLVIAEARFRAGMDLAARQQARPFELRNAVGLASLLAARGMGDEGRWRV